jgi:Xaa-Pro aminopeptidase
VSGARLEEVELPNFGRPGEEPVIPPEVYAARLSEARQRMERAGFDLLVVYADREHSANIAYLTGFEPRFEEALLILGPRDSPALIVGNECRGAAEAAKVRCRMKLYQHFSLMGQDRSASPPLSELLAGEGAAPGRRIGVVGWKNYRDAGETRPETWIDAPAYLVDALRTLAGDSRWVTNAIDLFTHPQDGLRVLNEQEQLAAFEFAACHTSTAVRNVLFGLRPGMSEFEAVRLMEWSGQPLSCHLMLSSGERAWLGLVSPTSRRIRRGDAFTTAFGIWGALNCRAGWVVEDAAELPPAIQDYVAKLVAPYFAAIAEWYEALGLGVTGGTLFDIVRRRLGEPFFGVSLNPGHQIHLDEWVNSPIYPGSDVELRSGMALQVDVIPATGGPYFTTNIEDGIALADESLRGQLANKYPQAWSRIQARRRFMADVLGIRLRPEVLPFSNIPAYLPPFLLRPGHVMRRSAS